MFWKIVDKYLYLIFDYVKEQFLKSIDGILFLLDLIGIDLWEILDDLHQYLNSKKAEEIKNEINDDIEDFGEDLITRLKGIDVFDSIEDSLSILDIFSSDQMATEFNKISTFDFNDFLIDDYNIENIIEKVAPTTMRSGFSLNPTDFKELIDDINEEFNDEYGPDLENEILQNYDFPENLEFQLMEELGIEIEEKLGEINDVDDLTFSGMNLLDNVSILDILPNLKQIDLNNAIDRIGSIMFEDVDGLIAISNALVDFVGKFDTEFLWRNDYELFLTISWLCLLSVQYGLDTYDYYKGLGKGLKDDSLVFWFAVIIFITAAEAKMKAEFDYQEDVAEYFMTAAGFILISVKIEIIVEVITINSPNDDWADRITCVVDIILSFISISITYDTFKKYDDTRAYYWAISDGIYGLSNAAWYIAGYIKNYYAIAAVGAAQICGFHLLWIGSHDTFPRE